MVLEKISITKNLMGHGFSTMHQDSANTDYLTKYFFDWNSFEVIVGGFSALDSKYYISDLKDKVAVHSFLKAYGLNQEDPVFRAELLGMFHEALQFIKRYFLKENNPDGIDLKIPHSFYLLTDTSELFSWAMQGSKVSEEERQWSNIILKIMHTLVHVDKDLRHNYFEVIQKQIFDRFYKHLIRDRDNKLFLYKENGPQIPLADFQTKDKKSRDSIVLKLLSKVEHVAEELFDRVGVRFITHNRADILRVIQFLHRTNIIIPHNIIPSRCLNSLVDLKALEGAYPALIEKAKNEKLSEENFLNSFNELVEKNEFKDFQNLKNNNTLKKYRSVQFTCRQLIRFQNPFVFEFGEVRKMAKDIAKTDEQNRLAQKVLALDYTQISKNIRFFYPFEVQVVDVKTHEINSKGEASHQEYKKQQLKASMLRLFDHLLRLKGMVG